MVKGRLWLLGGSRGVDSEAPLHLLTAMLSSAVSADCSELLGEALPSEGTSKELTYQLKLNPIELYGCSIMFHYI